MMFNWLKPRKVNNHLIDDAWNYYEEPILPKVNKEDTLEDILVKLEEIKTLLLDIRKE